MITTVLFISLLFDSCCPFANIRKPVLISENAAAVPVQNFDFVYIPKHEVYSHLPSFEPKKLKIEAEKIAKMYKIDEKKFPLTCTQNQVRLVDWHNRRKLIQRDPNGNLRRSMKLELEKLNGDLAVLIPRRRNLFIDIQRLQRTVQNRCYLPSNQRLSDVQYNECQAMKNQLMLNSRILMDLNRAERIILQREIDIRKRLKLL